MTPNPSKRILVTALGSVIALATLALADDPPPARPVPAQDALPVRVLPEPSPEFSPTAMTPALTTLSEARYEAAKRQFEELWLFYRERRTDTGGVYFWSRLMLESKHDLCPTNASWITALEEHLDRMTDLEALVRRVSRTGFTRKVDLKAVQYYHAEADYWLARAKRGGTATQSTHP
ncbi:MAG: hypothetical protein AB7I30_23790 [Isosphaeraceae bacterium]